MRSFVKIKPLRNGKITLPFIDLGKPCLSRDFLTSLICLLMLFAKIKFSRKFHLVGWPIYGKSTHTYGSVYEITILIASAACADPESFLRGGPTLNFFFFFNC